MSRLSYMAFIFFISIFSSGEIFGNSNQTISFEITGSHFRGFQAPEVLRFRKKIFLNGTAAIFIDYEKQTSVTLSLQRKSSVTILNYSYNPLEQYKKYAIILEGSSMISEPPFNCYSGSVSDFMRKGRKKSFSFIKYTPSEFDKKRHEIINNFIINLTDYRLFSLDKKEEIKDYFNEKMLAIYK